MDIGNSDLERGTIVTWSEWDSFGFARRASDSKADVFIHIRTTGRRLEPGTRVAFVVSHGPKGLRADHVRVVD